MAYFISFSLLYLSLTLLSKIESFGATGSKPASHGYPFFVLIEVSGKTCGGTLITNDAVLTAAKCLYVESESRWAFSEEVNVLKSDFTIRNWDHDLKRYIVNSFSHHESYNPEIEDALQPNNIAVIKLYDCVDISNPKNGFLQLCPPTMEYWKGFVIGIDFNHQHSSINTEVNQYVFQICSSSLK